MIGTKRIKRREGDVVSISLGNGMYAYGRVLKEPLLAFYDCHTSELISMNEIIRKPVAFIISVMNYAVTKGGWPVLGHKELEPELTTEPLFFKKDAITKQLSIYLDSTGEEFPATKKECEGLECAAVWDPEHVVDRLNDYFAGRPNKWVESMRP